MSLFPSNDVLFAVYNEVYRGYGGFGALGHKVYTRELSPKRVEGSWECRISEIATSGTHTAAITETGVILFSNQSYQIVSHVNL